MVYVSENKILLAVADSILKFHIGGATKAYILKCIGVKPKCNMLLVLRKQDSKRVYHSTRKISIKDSRRKRRADRKRKVDTKVSYLSDGFGLSIEPEVDLGLSPKPRKKKKVNKLNEPEIKLVGYKLKESEITIC